MTCNQKYSYFPLDRKLLTKFTLDELKIVHIDLGSCDRSICWLWYPKQRWFDRPIQKEFLKDLLSNAIESEDWAEVGRIRERMRS